MTSLPTWNMLGGGDDGLHVRRRRRRDRDCEPRNYRRGEHQLRAFPPPVIAQLGFHHVVGCHLRRAQHRGSRHRGADALVQPHHAFLRDDFLADLEHARRRELFGRRHLDHQQIGWGGDRGCARACDKAGGYFLPNREFFPSLARIKRDFQRFVQTEPQRAVRRFPQRRSGEAPVQTPQSLTLPDIRGLREHPKRIFAAHTRELLLHHRRSRPVHRALRYHAARAH